MTQSMDHTSLQPRGDREAHQLLRSDGTLRGESSHGVGEDVLLQGMHWMLLSRAFDVRATALQRQGRVGVVSPASGQEASVVASALAFDPRIDWLVPQYRELPAYLDYRHRVLAQLFAAEGLPTTASTATTAIPAATTGGH